MSEERALRDRLEQLGAQLAQQRAKADAKAEELTAALSRAQVQLTEALQRAEQAEARERALLLKLEAQGGPAQDDSAHLLVALSRPPPDPEAAAQLVANTGLLGLVDARMRLRAPPPVPLVRLSATAARTLKEALEDGGLHAVTTPARLAPDAFPEAARVAALDGRLEVELAGSGKRALPYAVLRLVVAARRARTATRKVQETTRRGRQLVTQSVEEEREEVDHFLWLFAAPDVRVAITEGTALELPGERFSTRSAAQQALASLLRARAPQAVHDDRLVRLARFSLPFVKDHSHELMAELLWACVRGGDARSGLGVP